MLCPDALHINDWIAWRCRYGKRADEADHDDEIECGSRRRILKSNEMGLRHVNVARRFSRKRQPEQEAWASGTYCTAGGIHVSNHAARERASISNTKPALSSALGGLPVLLFALRLACV